MDKQTEELFKKLDAMYYLNKKPKEQNFKEEKNNYYEIRKKVKEIKKEIKNLLKNNREELKLNYNFYMKLHKKLFEEIYPEISGKLRDVNVIKREDILNGQSVKYGTSLELRMEGKSFLDNFENKILKAPQTQKKETLIKNTIELWRKHYFFEGNTRTTALFIDIVALKHNIEINLMNKELKNFRNSLVLATENKNFNMLNGYFYDSKITQKEKNNPLVEKIQSKRENKEQNIYKGLTRK
ncbi:hypothetical protein FUSO6_08175 [Fusobacterium necrophorum DAB]|uniref:Fic family protein n=1 Tax=Fusobacterium necrophorum TaxID=859 RepID=UPI0004615A3D|nr:Fic family protein [Fusobacterium necrophorum]KDE68676.1 hypothetical protein FUSO6_08175 [Fusobacterium necrophorum DAB]